MSLSSFDVKSAGLCQSVSLLTCILGWSAADNELSWITAPFMNETTNAQSARFLTVPTVVEYCGAIHCGAIASLSILYGALDSILFIALCSFENCSSPSYSILGNHIPVGNIDRKFIMDVLYWSLKWSLGCPTLHVPSDSSPYSICLGILKLSMRATCPSHLRHRDCRMGYSD